MFVHYKNEELRLTCGMTFIPDVGADLGGGLAVPLCDNETVIGLFIICALFYHPAVWRHNKPFKCTEI